MAAENWLIIGILAVSLILFVWEQLRADVVALIVLVACVVTGLVPARNAFLGFADPAVVTVWTVFIISGGITRTGLAERIGGIITRLAGENERAILITMMGITATMSAFMNNIGAVAIMLPAVMGLCRRLDIPPSKMLMPLAVAALLGGNITLIGTPPNLIAVALMEQLTPTTGLQPFQFFDYTPTGLIVTVVGLIYMLLIGFSLLPSRTSGEEVSEGYEIPADLLTEAIVTEDSAIHKRRIRKVRFGLENDVALLYVRRGEQFLPQSSDQRLRAKDVLLIEGPSDHVTRVSQKLRLPLRSEWEAETIEAQLQAGGRLIEMTLSPRSRFRGLTLREIGFRSRYGVTVLAIRHAGESLVSQVVDVPLRFGDVLLTQGPADRYEGLKLNPNFIVLDNTPQKRGFRHEKGGIALAILLLTLIAVIFVPADAVSITMLIGAIAVVVTGVLTIEEAYDAIDWKAVFLIAGMLPLGEAMNNTGTAEILAQGVIAALGDQGPRVLLGAIFVLTAGLTSVISNAAATVLIIPIAVSSALTLGINPEPFVMTVVIAASSAFLLPIGHQANIIIYGLGGYRFADFLKVGIWLTLLLLVVVVVVMPLIWPF